MKARSIAHLVLLAALLSLAVFANGFPVQDAVQKNKASIWFEKEYSSYFNSSQDDGRPPVIMGVSISPSSLKTGSPRAEINAYVHDESGIETVYAEVGNRMNLMLDLDRDGRFTGYCGSNLPPAHYKVTIVAVDRSGNAAKDESRTLTIRDPNDLNGNGIEDSLEEQGVGEQRVIVLHENNVSSLESGSSQFRLLPVSALTVSRDKLEKIAGSKGVKAIYKDEKLRVLAQPGKQLIKSSPEQIDDPRSYKGYTGKGVNVALIDTGADEDHEALSGRILAFKDFVNNQTEAYDDNGHGTHCASLIGSDGGVGVAPDAGLVVIKVMDRDGACYTSDALKALEWCLENKDLYNIRIISFSVGGESPSGGSSLLDEACNRMVREGLVMCVAAGNSGPTEASIVVPGEAENVITVGAVDDSGAIFELSSRGPATSGEIKPDLVTMGVDVVSALAGSKSDQSSVSGTSMAVPLVSGGAAILLEADSSLSPPDVKRILLKTSDDLGPSGRDNIFGYGALNLTAALKSLNRDRSTLTSPALGDVDLNHEDAVVGEPVMIEAEGKGEVRAINANIIGPDRNMEIPMDDFDGNGIFSARWETSFWTAGEYMIDVDLMGEFGETDKKSVPFRLLAKG